FSFFSRLRPPPPPTLFPYTTLFRSDGGPRVRPLRGPAARAERRLAARRQGAGLAPPAQAGTAAQRRRLRFRPGAGAGSNRLGRRSEEHTSELQSRSDLVCRLLLEKK